VCANDVDVDIGRAVYTQWLNERGGIEADLTVTRLAEDRYFIVTAFATQVRDFHWLQNHIPDGAHAVLTDVTSGWATISVMGPRSRELLSKVTPADLSNDAFPFATAQEIEFGYAQALALRMTYVGELGWELYVPSEFAVNIYDAIVAEGESVGLKHAGYHALNSLRMEKCFRHWGHDITDEDTPLEAGLGFAVAWDKPGGFIGREALVKQKEAGVDRRLVAFALDDPEPLLYHNEPIWRDDRIVGHVTSGMFGHTLGRSIGLGYVHAGGEVSADWVTAGTYEIEVAGTRFSARPSLRPLYDSKAERVKV
jgi:4-methylaminobutanoate oxidase (formaldehyde-forming)